MDLVRDGKLAAAGLVLLLAGVMIGRYTVPTKTITKTETKIVEKEVVKSSDTDIKTIKKNSTLVETETILPDGTHKIERRYVNNDEIVDKDVKLNVTTDTKSTDIKSMTVTTNEKNNWNLSALATTSHTEDDIFREKISYGIHVQRRIIGPFSVGAFGLTNRTYGISIGGSF
jgi:lipopolysaccharide export LptBFGC system permease protein LptF